MYILSVDPDLVRTLTSIRVTDLTVLTEGASFVYYVNPLANNIPFLTLIFPQNISQD
jgi:hypothetical protein